jgi:hypothetical protein
LTPACKNYSVLVAFEKKGTGAWKFYFGAAQEKGIHQQLK